jgi:hypothetical protein
MLLGFHTNHLTERGSERAIYDYALALKHMYSIEPRVFVPAASREIVPEVRRQFAEHFDVVLYKRPDEIECDALYVIKRGRRSCITQRLPELVHAMFDADEPHGARFATISHWLSRQSRRVVRLPRGRSIRLPRLRKPAYVPHIVEVAEVDGDLRGELGIPEDAVVFGRHGALRSFSITWVQHAVSEALETRPDAWFLLLNTERFLDHPRVRFLDMTLDRERIRAFVNSCDYMLHARREGESFGIAVAEFAAAGVQILSFAHSRDRAHFEHVPAALMIRYGGHDEVLMHLRSLPRRLPTPALGAVVRERFSASVVAPTFEQVFLT